MEFRETTKGWCGAQGLATGGNYQHPMPRQHAVSRAVEELGQPMETQQRGSRSPFLLLPSRWLDPTSSQRARSQAMQSGVGRSQSPEQTQEGAD